MVSVQISIHKADSNRLIKSKLSWLIDPAAPPLNQSRALESCGELKVVKKLLKNKRGPGGTRTHNHVPPEGNVLTIAPQTLYTHILRLQITYSFIIIFQKHICLGIEC